MNIKYWFSPPLVCPGFLVQNKDYTGRHTNNPDGYHPIQTVVLHLCHPHFTPDALTGTTLPICPGLRQAPSTLACITSGLETANAVQSYTNNILPSKVHGYPLWLLSISENWLRTYNMVKDKSAASMSVICIMLAQFLLVFNLLRRYELAAYSFQ